MGSLLLGHTVIAWGLHQGFAHILVHCKHHLYNEEDECDSLDKDFQGPTPACHSLSKRRSERDVRVLIIN